MKPEFRHSLKFNDLEEMKSWAQDFAQKNLTSPHLILLSGDLGAGKTQLTTYLAEAIGCRDDKTSPSFSIINQYQASNGLNLYHVDLYRLESSEDLESTGFWDLFSITEGYVVVEWANRLDESVWPQTWTRSYIEISRDLAE